MRTRRLGVALVALVASTTLLAQQPDKPQLTAKQIEASRALREMARPDLVPRPSLLVDPMNRSVYVDRGVIFDPDQPRTAVGQLTEAVCLSDVVVSGVVEDHAAFFNEDASFILTEYLIRVEGVLRGKVEDQKVLSYIRPEGSMNIRGRVVSATHNLYPPLVRGLKYVVFAKRIGVSGQYRPTGSTIDTLQADSRNVKALGPSAEAQFARGLESSSVLREIAAVGCGK